MLDSIKKAPYYDKYDKSKKYTQLLAVPGRVAQAREITEIQSTMKDIIKSLGDSMMNDGNVIEGCQVIPDKSTKRVRITAGRVYMQGMVFEIKDLGDPLDPLVNAETRKDPDFGKNFLTMRGTGTEIIGLKLKESIVYADNDPDLLDPSTGYENFNQPGMDRLKSEIELVCVDSSEADTVAELATLVDGELYVEQQAPNYSALTETLARRTYDESGSYIVDGLDVRIEENSDDTLFNVVVESGKAYVHGYELRIPSARKITLPRAMTTASVTAEYSYSSDISTKYLLTNGPYLQSITKVTAALQVSESVNINNDQSVSLNKPAYKIISVSKSGSTLSSSNYHLEQGVNSYIKWDNTSYPGESVVVTYLYRENFTENTDFQKYQSADGDYYLLWKSTTRTPVAGESISIAYEKYLARKDTVYMDQYGNISAIQGIPAEYGLEVAPEAPAYTLPLASIMSPPGGNITTDIAKRINVSNVGLTRFTMSDIHRMLRRIRTIEYDQTVISLNTEAKEYGIDDKKGIFTDPFIDLTKVSLDFNLDYNNLVNGNPTSLRNDYAKDLSNQNVVRVPTFDTTIDLDGNLVYLPLIRKVVDMEYNSSDSTGTRYDRVVSLRKSGERPVLSQMKATKSFLVSPYLSYPQSPEIFISPSMDTWFDDSYVEVPVSINKSNVVSTSSRNYYTTSTSSSTKKSGSGSASTVSYKKSTETTMTSSTITSAIGNTVEKLVEENVIKEESVMYIRPRKITVKGSNYPSNLDNIKCYFEGVEAALTPIGSTIAGTVSGSVKASSGGSFTAEFTIPDRILTGTRVVELKSNIIVDGYSNTAATFYQAIGTARTIQRTITTINTVLLERVTENYYNTNTHTTKTIKYYDPDPLAQTFVLDTMTLLSGIDIYFENVPSGSVPVTCEIREVNDGNITSKIYGFKTKTSDQITVSSEAKEATRFTFNDPVLIEPNKEYAFVLRSSSQEFRVFVAEIGEIDIQSQERVTANPYLLGVMMSSSNNRSWTNHQKADVKFQLWADTYEKSSEIIFNNVNVSQDSFCRSYLTAESLVFDGTSLDWYYSDNGGLSYDHITPYNMNVLDHLADTTLSLKAKLSRTDDATLSPLLALDSVSMSLERYDNTKDGYYYVSKFISGLDPYSTVDIFLDTIEPSGVGDSSIQVYVSTDDDNATTYHMIPATVQSSTTMNYGWRETQYRATVGSNKTQCRIFVRLKSSINYRTPAFRRLRAIMS